MWVWVWVWVWCAMPHEPGRIGKDNPANQNESDRPRHNGCLGSAGHGCTHLSFEFPEHVGVGHRSPGAFIRLTFRVRLLGPLN